MIVWLLRAGRGVLPWLGALLIACNAFDDARLERHSPDVSGRGGNGGGGNGGNGNGGSGGTGGDSSSAPCGDGRVSTGEKCDIAIDEGPGACPTECPPIADCVTRMLNGSNCQAECLVLAAVCADADGCCPESCSLASDDDCPDHCGDGIVQEDEGETCEPDADAGPPCPTQADCDDGDPCTTDTLVGSEANCNPSCTRTTISTLQPGDQCCPAGANANTDSDCQADCGNQIEEPGEECDDGSASCDADCKIIPTAEQQDCLDRFVDTGTPDAPCQRCACFECTQRVLDCRDDSDATRRMRCDAVVACGLENDCEGMACYCGTAELLACGTGGANGPCISEVEEAAGPSEDPIQINMRQSDPNYALGRANLLGACGVTQCPDVCP